MEKSHYQETLCGSGLFCWTGELHLTRVLKQDFILTRVLMTWLGLSFTYCSDLSFIDAILKHIDIVPCNGTFSVLLYSSILFCCSLLFILLCFSSCYVCVVDCIYCTLTMPPGVNPIAVNNYLCICLSVYLIYLSIFPIFLKHTHSCLGTPND